MIVPFFFDATVTGSAYLIMLQHFIMPSINSLLLGEGLHFQQDGETPHYHTDMRYLLDVCFPGRWIVRRGSVEYPPRSSDLTPVHFFLCGDLTNAVYTSNPRTLQDLRRETETARAALFH
jgi:hypothetical protein